LGYDLKERFKIQEKIHHPLRLRHGDTERDGRQEENVAAFVIPEYQN
jgi:hypothetical protein